MQVESTSFCKSTNKLIKEWIVVLLILISLFSVEYIFGTEGITYFQFLYQELFDFDLLSLLILLLLFYYFEKDCIQYDQNLFKIRRGLQKAEYQTYKIEDIVKINYMPYLHLYTLTMKQEDTYIDFNAGFYPTEEFQKFLVVLQTEQPINRGFYMPSGVLSTPLTYAGALIFLGFLLLLIAIGLILR